MNETALSKIIINLVISLWYFSFETKIENQRTKVHLPIHIFLKNV